MISRLTLLLATLAVPVQCVAESSFDQVAQIFSEHCVRCHNDANSKGDFSLATSDSLSESGMVIGGDEASELLNVISGPDATMPKEGDRLSDQQVQTVRDWILNGALWPDDHTIREKSKADHSWWSLQPLQDFDATQTIDTFIDQELQKNKLVKNEPADKRTLIRRAYYSLTGLPPTPDEISVFVNDQKPDAYERLIDRLLQSPRYGERWGRHWLDVVRFGESNGFERNILINDLWPFRDYVIKSFNDDKPFDQLLREHLAGDVIGAGDPNVAIGSAFLVAGPYDNVGNQDAAQRAQIRANTIDEMIRATSSAFLGLTVGCARCHDHKFDPILQSDYYKLYATFAGTHHGSRQLASAQQLIERNEKLKPLQDKRSAWKMSARRFESQLTTKSPRNVKRSRSNGFANPSVAVEPKKRLAQSLQSSFDLFAKASIRGQPLVRDSGSTSSRFTLPKIPHRTSPLSPTERERPALAESTSSSPKPTLQTSRSMEKLEPDLSRPGTT